MYFYLLSWLALFIQLVALVFSIGKSIGVPNMEAYHFLRNVNKIFIVFIGAGLFYLAELIEEYATVAKKYLNFIIIVSQLIMASILLVAFINLFILRHILDRYDTCCRFVRIRGFVNAYHSPLHRKQYIIFHIHCIVSFHQCLFTNIFVVNR